jgi:DNA-binding NarL/FixJ family response regulator
MIRIVVADDHTLVRTGLKQMIAATNDLTVVGEAASSAEVIERLSQHSCDLLLLDLNMPGIRSATLITQIKAQYGDLPILILSMHNEPQTASRMLKAGASGFITKNCDLEVLLAAIHTVAASGNYLDPEIAAKLVINSTARKKDFSHLALSERELEVLQLMIAGQSLVAIAAHLFISRKTVSTHKARLMEKLNVDNMASLMRYALHNDLLGRTL